MDLRSIINDEGGGRGTEKKLATPITPIQTGHTQQPYQGFSQPGQSARGKQHSQDYGPGPVGPPRYASPPAPANYQGYQGRGPQPNVLQSPLQVDLRSPGVASQQYHAVQSPFRHASSSSISGGQYPFPQSPAQAQPYPNPLQQRESYPAVTIPPAHSQHANSYGQPSPTPQPPAAGTSTYPYAQHQRSQSTHSASTPTSAHSQQPYGSQYPHDSPLSATAFPPQQLPAHRSQQSQPGTPLGPPISIPRQMSGGFPQPSSPLQQRPPSSGASHLQYPAVYHSPAHQSATIPTSRLSTPSIQGSHRSSIEEQNRRSYSERELSLSVSPKTQITPLPSKSEMAVPPAQSVENGNSPGTKRKFDDRQSSEPAPVLSATNGDYIKREVPASQLEPPKKKPKRYSQPPVWAQSYTGRVKKGHPRRITAQVNGSQTRAMPLTSSPRTNGHVQASQTPAGPPILHSTAETRKILGDWEPSITGVQPYEEVTKIIADFLFNAVVTRHDSGELKSRGVEVEIEAKLGQLIDQDTNQRLHIPVRSECVLTDRNRVSFESSMTEVQHKTLNEYLNAQVKETHPLNENAQSRIPIMYTHRRERDTFYELPKEEWAALPASIRSEVNKRHAIKVRVTYDQKSGAVLAKIIKARVADINIYNPCFPLDCRISVNLEMRYDGDVESLVKPSDGTAMPDRNKDRLSYKQNLYQVDLTQVTSADKAFKKHELEIELSAAAVREQGQLAMAGKPHKYAELVQGMVDNVRVLTRAVPP